MPGFARLGPVIRTRSTIDQRPVSIHASAQSGCRIRRECPTGLPGRWPLVRHEVRGLLSGCGAPNL